MDEDKASRILAQYEGVVRIVAASVVENFPQVAEQEDVEQEARILLLSYAGMVPGGRHAGVMTEWEQLTDGDPDQLSRLTTNELKLDLNQMYGREADKLLPSVSADALPEHRHPSYEIEDPMLDHLDTDQLRLDFPYLTARYLDGLTETELADSLDVSRSTITRRVAKERDVFLVHFLNNRGVRVEGDESTEELLEAYGYLKDSGR